ncbi:MAG: hypothetical protein IPN64_06630 [Propionivibrio sp.]|uniref:hypothetical protein n=1 Tax=Propionivibrio sp. TaxID=2212460 RepID=UPI0025D406E7|nr:hypothetical protein [Propionivibrio sp.]MBK8893728.1 hypothetical protein [Propionivibrio sp.]
MTAKVAEYENVVVVVFGPPPLPPPLVSFLCVSWSWLFYSQKMLPTQTETYRIHAG